MHSATVPLILALAHPCAPNMIIKAYVDGTKNAIGLSIPDPIEGEVHKAHAGEVVASTTSLRRDDSDELAKVSTTFTLHDDIHLHAYLTEPITRQVGGRAKSACQTWRVEINETGSDNVLVLNEEELNESRSLREISESTEFPLDTHLNRVYRSTGGPPQFGWQLVRHLQPGHHTFDLRFVVACSQPDTDAMADHVLASGALSLEVKKGDVASYLERLKFTFPVAKFQPSSKMTALARKLLTAGCPHLKDHELLRVRPAEEAWTYVRHQLTNEALRRDYGVYHVYRDRSTGSCYQAHAFVSQERVEGRWGRVFLRDTHPVHARSIVCSPMPR
ncbi:MAG: hypothetical protein ACI9MC_002689 [Kiritimatiellia bacterium]|jgi:hypothetical protein